MSAYPAGEAASRLLLRRELIPWTLLGLALGLVEGATAAVLIKSRFGGESATWSVNLAVAMVSGAPALSNVVSFIWANIAHGRPRVQMIVAMQMLFAIVVGVVGLAPQASRGLALTVVSILVARMVWAGLLTIRTTVWIANYPRQVLAQSTGRIVVVSSLSVASMAAITAWTLDHGAIDPRWLYGGAALSGLLGAWLYRTTRVRREFKLLDAETSAATRSGAFSLRMVLEILRGDRDFGRYMFWMGLYGGGNLMLVSQLVVVLSDHLQVEPSRQIMMLAVVPLLMPPACTPFWARLFDGQHVVAYRARQAWALVFAGVVLVAAAFARSEPLLWGGALLLGFANAGAHLGWNLGHNDFATPGRAQHYMGVHVTLTGVRGMLAPPLGMLLYQWLEARAPGAGRWALILPLALLAGGASGFNAMHREHQRRANQAGDG